MFLSYYLLDYCRNALKRQDYLMQRKLIFKITILILFLVHEHFSVHNLQDQAIPFLARLAKAINYFM